MWKVGSLTAAVMILASCGGSPIRPSDGAGNPPPPPPPLGEITVNDVTPGSGATLRMRDCGPSGLCNDQLKTTFEVLVRSDIPDALLMVSLSRGGSPCAWTWLRTTLAAGDRATFSSSSIRMVLDEEGRLLCPLPFETTRLVFEVRGSSPIAPLLYQEAAYRYMLEREPPQ